MNENNSTFVIPSGWTESDMKFLCGAREDGFGFYVISLALKKPISEIKFVFNSTKWSLAPFYDLAKGRLNEVAKKEYLMSKADLEDSKIESDIIKTQVIVDRMEQIVEPYPKAPELAKKGVVKETHRPEDVGLVLSDIHIGLDVTKRETNGLGEYNYGIFLQRMESLKKNGASIVSLHSKLYKMPKLHIFCLGDIVAGMNDAGNWSSTSLSMSIYDQAWKGYEVISEMIYYWLGMFDEVIFYGVIGNHGRSAKKGVEKDYVNWDLICYKFIELRFKDNPRVKFNVPESWFINTEIRNHKFLLIHGDQVRSADMNKIEDSGTNLCKLIGFYPNYILAGHFHCAGETSTHNGKIIVNGSFVGGDLYSLKELQKSARPVQKMFGIHEEHGITWTYDIRL